MNCTCTAACYSADCPVVLHSRIAKNAARREQDTGKKGARDARSMFIALTVAAEMIALDQHGFYL